MTTQPDRAMEIWCEAMEAMCETLAGALEKIANEGGELYNAWIDDGCDPKDAIRGIDDIARIACQALTQYRAMKEKSDADT